VKYDDKGNFAELSDREVVSASKKWLAIGLALAILIPVAIWFISVIDSRYVGNKNAHKIVNNPLNQITQYNHFYDLDAAIKTHVVEIKNNQAALTALTIHYPVGTPDPTGQIAQQFGEAQSAVTGAASLCAANVNTYNNDAQKYTSGDFRDKNLPDHEDPAVCALPVTPNPTKTTEVSK
jgi:hypothetical protein